MTVSHCLKFMIHHILGQYDYWYQFFIVNVSAIVSYLRIRPCKNLNFNRKIIDEVAIQCSTNLYMYMTDISREC